MAVKMKRIISSFVFTLIIVVSFSQTIDTIITNSIYKSYFNYKTHNPLFVGYILYKGGGECSRAKMRFTTNGLAQSAKAKDYAHSGYDIGHMANAEDFAGDCEKEKQTFYFYNALPLRPELNRGCWSKIEAKIRKQSQTDSLLIVCGGYQFDKKIGSIAVPSYCFKIVKNTSKRVINCYLFPNDSTNTYQEIELSKLIKQIPFGNKILKEFNL